MKRCNGCQTSLDNEVGPSRCLRFGFGRGFFLGPEAVGELAVSGLFSSDDGVEGSGQDHSVGHIVQFAVGFVAGPAQ